jgi:short-subunit dehydrogenase
MSPLIVVSGGTKGIGRAILERFAAEGFDLVTCARRTADLSALQADFTARYPGRTLHTYPADLARPADRAGFVAFIQALDRPVEVLVNNAGRFLPGTFHEEPDGTLEAMIETNLYSAYHLTRGLLGAMLARRRGYIVNVCSTASLTAYPNGGSYSVSKFALLGFTKTLRQEVKTQGLRVTAILPGATLTESWAGTDLPADRFMQPADVAALVWASYSLSDGAVVEEILLRPLLGDV